jgi:hydroxypyruvate isomerase
VLRFDANLGMLFCELPFRERFAAAARAGFRAVEYPFPYSYPLAELQEGLEQNGLIQVLHNLPPGDFAKGERGIACLPDRKGEFQDSVGLALQYARGLRCPQVNCLAGIAAGVPRDVAFTTFVDNLKFAAQSLAQAGVRLLIEPINTTDMPGFFLCHSAQALAVLDAVDSPNLALQYDVYHMQVMEGDPARSIAQCISRIGHFQVADHPGRHEPGTGGIDYRSIFALIDRLDYQGWIGCEYHPISDTERGIGWLDAYR